MQYFEKLRTASFRGVPFAVKGGEAHFGRRTALHEYPYRNQPWVEDLGRATRVMTVDGFLVGDDVNRQRDAMIIAAERPGEAELIHPTYGALFVTLTRGGLECRERWDEGRYFELRFNFVIAGQRVYPSVTTSTVDAVTAAANAADQASSADFLTRASDALRYGASVVRQAVDTVALWARRVQRLANDATNLYHMVGTLKGTFSRYFGGRGRGGIAGITGAITGVSGSIDQLMGIGTRSLGDIGQFAGVGRSALGGVDQLISFGAQARGNVVHAASSLSNLVGGLGL